VTDVLQNIRNQAEATGNKRKSRVVCKRVFPVDVHLVCVYIKDRVEKTIEGW